MSKNLYWKNKILNENNNISFCTTLKCVLHPAGNYMFKVNNKNSRTRCEICSKLTVKTSSLLTLNIFHILFYFEQVNAGWAVYCTLVTLKTDKVLEIFNGLVVTFTTTKHIRGNRYGIRYVLDMVFLDISCNSYLLSYHTSVFLVFTGGIERD